MHQTLAARALVHRLGGQQRTILMGLEELGRRLLRGARRAVPIVGRAVDDASERSAVLVVHLKLIALR